MRVADVFVDKAAYHFDTAFSYRVPQALEDTLAVGCRVLVPFGAGNHKRQGMVVGLSTAADDNKLKPIAQQLDDEPMFGEEAMALAEWLANTTFCTRYEAVKAMLPSGLSYRLTEQVRLSKPLTTEEWEAFPFAERELLAFLQKERSMAEVDAFLSANRGTMGKGALDRLLSCGAAERVEQAKRKRKDDTIAMVRLTGQELPAGKKLSKKQQEIVSFLEEAGTASREELLYFCAAGKAVLDRVVAAGLCEVYEREVLPMPQTHLADAQTLPTLNDEQRSAYRGIAALMDEGKPSASLLYGVTGSGKTSVYLHLIRHALDGGRQAMMLVPEIALTPQIVSLFLAVFGEQVAVMHSGLSVGERMNTYKRIRQGKVSVVVGTRSAVFAPLSNIGLLILDEEAEPSYKSDKAPRYHAREVAKFRAVRHQAALVLGSATPSIESMYKAEQGVYHLFTLRKRYAVASLPEVYLIDRREEYKRGNTKVLSEMLRYEIQKNLDRGEQTILFINRRGFRTAVHCMDCGEVIKCPNCSVPMTYHKDNGYLMCHYCGYAAQFHKRCPSCGSDLLKLTGVGTQHLEEELTECFPTARILRMDTDTTSSKGAFTEKFAAFARQEYDILLGTQMIAKGLDFPQVTLVGVVNADSGLYSPDFRGVERTFALITQVVGRSGRAEKQGRAYLQTEQPDHPVIQYAARQDYDGFYQEELQNRQALCYPPFCDLCMIHLAAAKEEQVQQAANALLCLLKEEAEQSAHAVPLRVLGPLVPALSRLNGKYRLQILVKCRMKPKFRRYLHQVLCKAGRLRELRGVTIAVDVNGDLA